MTKKEIGKLAAVYSTQDMLDNQLWKKVQARKNIPGHRFR
jgi:hypothetical protein